MRAGSDPRPGAREQPAPCLSEEDAGKLLQQLELIRFLPWGSACSRHRGSAQGLTQEASAPPRGVGAHRDNGEPRDGAVPPAHRRARRVALSRCALSEMGPSKGHKGQVPGESQEAILP